MCARARLSVVLHDRLFFWHTPLCLIFDKRISGEHVYSIKEREYLKVDSLTSQIEVWKKILNLIGRVPRRHLSAVILWSKYKAKKHKYF